MTNAVILIVISLNDVASFIALVIARMLSTLMRINQLPVSANRWQQGSRICFANFIKQKITKLLITQQQLTLN